MLRRSMTGPHRRAGETNRTSQTTASKHDNIEFTNDGHVIVDGQSYKLALTESNEIDAGSAIYVGVAVAPDDRDFGKWRKRALLYGMYNYSRYVVAADFKQVDERVFDVLKAMLYKNGVPSQIYASKSFLNTLSTIQNCTQYLDEFEAELGVRFIMTPPKDSSVKRSFSGITSRLYHVLSLFIVNANGGNNNDYESVVDRACYSINSCRCVDKKYVCDLYKVEKRSLRFPNKEI